MTDDRLLNKYQESGNQYLVNLIVNRIDSYIDKENFLNLDPHLLFPIFQRCSDFGADKIANIICNVLKYHNDIDFKVFLCNFPISNLERRKCEYLIREKIHYVSTDNYAPKIYDIESRLKVLEADKEERDKMKMFNVSSDPSFIQNQCSDIVSSGGSSISGCDYAKIMEHVSEMKVLLSQLKSRVEAFELELDSINNSNNSSLELTKKEIYGAINDLKDMIHPNKTNVKSRPHEQLNNASNVDDFDMRNHSYPTNNDGTVEDRHSLDDVKSSIRLCDRNVDENGSKNCCRTTSDEPKTLVSDSVNMSIGEKINNEIVKSVDNKSLNNHKAELKNNVDCIVDTSNASKTSNGARSSLSEKCGISQMELSENNQDFLPHNYASNKKRMFPSASNNSLFKSPSLEVKVESGGDSLMSLEMNNTCNVPEVSREEGIAPNEKGLNNDSDNSESKSFYSELHAACNSAGKEKYQEDSDNSPKKTKRLKNIFDFVEMNDVRKVRTLLTKNPGLVHERYNGNSPLHRAVKLNLMEMTKLLLLFKANVHAKNMNGETPLFFAKDRAMCQVLTDAGAKVNERNKNFETPLFFADNKEVCLYLLENGSNVNEKNNHGEIPLFYAGNREACELLVSYKANVKERDNYGNSALHFSAIHGCIDSCQFFIENGISVNDKNNNKSTPIFHACRLEQVEYLFNRGAIINEPNCKGELPFLFSANVEVLEYYLSKGMNINYKDNDGNSIIHFSARSGRKEVLRYLIRMGMSVNEANKYGETPLHIACKHGKRDICNILMTRRADVNAKSVDGNTPLHYAISKGYLEICGNLIMNGAGIDEPNDMGDTPLHNAVLGEIEDVVDFTINNNANVNKRNNKGLTPLHLAVIHNNKKICQLLLDNGAHPTIEDKNGHDCMYYAKSYNLDEIYQLLVMHVKM